MPRISSPRPLDLTKPFVTSSQSYGSQPFDLSRGLVTWYRDVQGDFVPDLSGRGNTARCGGIGSIPGVTGSNDTPEYNPLNYPIRSFDFSENGTAADARHIRSVGDDGLAVSSEDHTFTDGTRDIPFSVSFWLKHSNQTGTQYLAVKGAVVGTSYEWEIRAESSLRIRLYSAGSSSDYIQAFELGATSADWDHFVITYDGSGTSNGINMYKNGDDLNPSKSLVGTYVRMQNSNLGLCVGTAFSNTSYAISGNDFRGKVHSFAIWKNRIISESEAEALYYAYTNGTGGEALGGFISRSPRLMLRELDDLPGSYSTVRRTGDPTRTGALSSNFNDETAIVFSEAGNVVFPTMLPKGSSFASQAVDIIGQESDISASLPIRSFQQPNHLHYSPTEEVGPFDENRSLPASNFFLNGTDTTILPGFRSPMRSKISFAVDITPESETTFTRNVQARNTAEGQPTGLTNSGFMYYNFARREWEQIGRRDPAVVAPLYYDYDISSYDLIGGVSPSGTLPAQFSVSPSRPYVGDDEKNQLGYSKIGTPISAFGAPNAEMYHATSSQCLRMSDFISEPFLLEAVRVEFEEVKAQRIQGDSFVGTPDSEELGLSGLFQSGSIRDIDNYVFFMYRQSRKNRVVDSVADVSSSERYLILSGAMTFWNSSSFESNQVRYENQDISFGLTHSPAFSYEFGLPYSSSLNTRLVDWDPSHDTYYVNNSLFDVTSNCVAHFNFETTKSSLEQEPDKTGNGHVATIGAGGAEVQGPEFGDYPTSYYLGSNFFESGTYISNRGCLNLETDGGAAADIMTINHAADLQMSRSSQLAIAFWLKPVAAALGAEQWVISKSDMFGDAEYAVRLDSSNKLEFRVYDATSTDYTNKYLGIRTNNAVFSSFDDFGWKHIIVSYSGGFTSTSLVISVNGTQVGYSITTNGGVDTPSFAPNNLTAPVRVGSMGGGSTTDLQGKIGSLEFYNVHILSTTASKLYFLQETPFLNTLAVAVGQFTGSIDMNLRPSVCNRQSFGVSAYSNADLQNVWLGGTSFKKFNESSWTVYGFYPANPFEVGNAGGPGSGPYSGRTIDDNRFSAIIDSRASRFFGLDASDSPLPQTQTVSGIYVSNDRTAQETTSPYLLTPEDELIFGIDAGICSLPFLSGEGNLSHLTGSHFVIPPKKCKVTFFGSLVKNGAESSINLNQDLSSDSIHEIIGAEPQLDQFQISPISSYYGSYLDEIVTGSMATPSLGGIFFSTESQDQSRRVISRVSLGQAGTTGSLQRFLKLSDTEERTYDSCLPSYADFLNGSNNIDVQLYNNQFFNISNFEKISVDWLNFERDLLESGGFLANQFPFQFDPKRNVNIPRGFIQIDRYGGPEETDSRIYATDDDRTAERFGLLIARDLIFRTRYMYREFWLNVDPGGFYNYGHKIGSGSGDPLPRNEKVGTYRYGISNIEPEFTSIRWRSDHYGYFRDMLEPRQHVTTVDGNNPIKIRFVSGSNVLKDPTATHTQNLSTFATSSMPFFDDEVARNRSDNPDETLLSV